MTDTLAPGGGMTVVPTNSGFEWRAAGIGAATALGVLLFASFAAVAVLRRRGRHAF